MTKPRMLYNASVTLTCNLYLLAKLLNFHIHGNNLLLIDEFDSYLDLQDQM